MEKKQPDVTDTPSMNGESQSAILQKAKLELATHFSAAVKKYPLLDPDGKMTSDDRYRQIFKNIASTGQYSSEVKKLIEQEFKDIFDVEDSKDVNIYYNQLSKPVRKKLSEIVDDIAASKLANTTFTNIVSQDMRNADQYVYKKLMPEFTYEDFTANKLIGKLKSAKEKAKSNEPKQKSPTMKDKVMGFFDRLGGPDPKPQIARPIIPNFISETPNISLNLRSSSKLAPAVTTKDNKSKAETKSLPKNNPKAETKPLTKNNPKAEANSKTETIPKADSKPKIVTRSAISSGQPTKKIKPNESIGRQKAVSALMARLRKMKPNAPFAVQVPQLNLTKFPGAEATQRKNYLTQLKPAQLERAYVYDHDSDQFQNLYNNISIPGMDYIQESVKRIATLYEIDKDPSDMAKTIKSILAKLPLSQRNEILTGILQFLSVVATQNLDQVDKLPVELRLLGKSLVKDSDSPKQVSDYIVTLINQPGFLYDMAKFDQLAISPNTQLTNLERPAPIGSDTYGTGGNLAAFPHWIGSQAAKQKSKLQSQQQRNKIFSGVGNKQQAFWKDLSEYDPGVFWSQAQKRYTGSTVDMIRNKIQKNKDLINKKSIKTAGVLRYQLNDAQFEKKVPAIIKQLVQDNKQVCATGFGPIKANGLPLYAGRWQDPVTGQLRILPTATTKYVNPFSFQQNVAYHQARQLNLWNQIVNQEQILISLASRQFSFETQQRKKLINQLHNSTQLMPILKKILEILNIHKMTSGKVNTWVNKILNKIDPEQLALYRVDLQAFVSQNQQKKDPPGQRMTFFYDLWIQLVKKGYKRLQGSFATDTLTYPEEVRAQSKVDMTNSYLRLTDMRQKPIGAAMKQMVKAAYIPKTMTMSNMFQATEKYDTNLSRIKQWVTQGSMIPKNVGAKDIKLMRQLLQGNQLQDPEIGSLYDTAQTEMGDFLDNFKPLASPAQVITNGTLRQNLRALL